MQRCLLNLEKDILAKTDLDPKWKQWAWMKRYRVWEANRKVFLYPENWIEPELRDEKSPFFLELEQELMQQDVTLDTAEDAYRNYLEKLDKVANLEIRAMFDEPLSQNEYVLHVFGRTRSSTGPEYFYRKRINRARWTAWEAVPLDITGDHLVAGRAQPPADAALAAVPREGDRADLGADPVAELDVRRSRRRSSTGRSGCSGAS